MSIKRASDAARGRKLSGMRIYSSDYYGRLVLSMVRSSSMSAWFTAEHLFHTHRMAVSFIVLRVLLVFEGFLSLKRRSQELQVTITSNLNDVLHKPPSCCTLMSPQIHTQCSPLMHTTWPLQFRPLFSLHTLSHGSWIPVASGAIQAPSSQSSRIYGWAAFATRAIGP